jgi:hypothetical protein
LVGAVVADLGEGAGELLDEPEDVVVVDHGVGPGAAGCAGGAGR